jgi:50S ribosome-binding GTPase
MIQPDVISAWIQIRSLLESLVFIPGVVGETDTRGVQANLLKLLDDKLILESSGRLPLIVIISGGTNVGKSSLINWITDRTVSAVSELARGTKNPVICGHDADIEMVALHWKTERFIPLQEQDQSPVLIDMDESVVFTVALPGFPPEGCVLVDCPDFDSNHPGNRIWADRLLTVSDAVLLVVTPEKYNDAVVVEFLGKSQSLQRKCLGIFNKADGQESWRDFVDSVWTGHSESACLIPRHIRGEMPDSASLSVIREAIHQFHTRRNRIKREAVQGTRRAFLDGVTFLIERAEEEQIWLESVSETLETIISDSADWYRRELKKEKFIEVDSMFHRLLDQYHIRVIDDIYSAVRKGSRVIWNRLKSIVGAPESSRELYSRERRRREQMRVRSVIGMIQSRLLRLPEHVPVPIRPLAEQWISHWQDHHESPDIEAFINEVVHRVDLWIEKEAAAMADKVRDNPNLHRFLITCKLSFQVGFGLVGAYLLGGFNPSDVILAPALERLAALSMEMGLGKAYFLSRRNELLDMRDGMIRSFVERTIIESLRKAMPDLPEDQGSMLRTARQSVPGIGEILS